MNQQRQVIYDQRRLVLSETNLRPIIQDIMEDKVRSLIASATANEDEDEWDIPALKNALGRIVGLAPAELPIAWEKQSPEQITEQALKLVNDAYDRREAELGEDMRKIERLVMLRVIDTHWVRHLTDLDELREGIGLRAVGQRNPLVEYKREAYNSFETLLQKIQSDIAEMIMNVRLVQEPKAAHATRYSGAGVSSQSKSAPVRKTKIGRNDPCPCGSGRKYKNCCLLEGLSPEQAAAKGRQSASAPAKQAQRQTQPSPAKRNVN